MSRNGSYVKSMNGIVSFDDGDGTTIEGNTINTDIINCTTLNASLDVNSINTFTDFIATNANTNIQVLSDTYFNDNVYVGDIYSKDNTFIYLKNSTSVTGSIKSSIAISTPIIEALGGVSASDLNIGVSNNNTLAVYVGRKEIIAAGVTFQAIPARTTFYAIGDDDIANKKYVDTASAGSNILPLTNTFTGTSNTFDNSLIASNIQKPSTGNAKIYNKIGNDDTINMFSDSLNTFGGIINFCCGTGLNSPTVNILTGVISSSPLYFQYLNLGGLYSFVKLCNSITVSNDAIKAVTTGNTQDIFKTTTNTITIGSTGKVLLGNNISVTGNTLESGGTTDTINLFNNISGTIGKINIASKFVISELSIASTSVTDFVSLFNNLSGLSGTVKMVTNLLFRESSILSTAVTVTIDLFKNITTGILNLATAITTGTINIGTSAITSGNINIGRSAMTGNTVINKSKIGPNGLTMQNIRYGTFTTGTPTNDYPTYVVTHSLGSAPLFASAIVDRTGFGTNDSFTASIFGQTSTTITFMITRVNSNNSGWGNNYLVRWMAFN